MKRTEEGECVVVGFVFVVSIFLPSPVFVVEFCFRIFSFSFFPPPFLLLFGLGWFLSHIYNHSGVQDAIIIIALFRIICTRNVYVLMWLGSKNGR